MNEIPIRDIHLPDAVNWWPLAIGWWLLPLLIIIIIFVIYQFIKIKQHNEKVAYKKFALTELNKIRQQFEKEKNSSELIRAISALLRRIALSYLPRQKIASLTGQQWFKQLNKLSSESVFSDEIITLLEQAPYQKQSQFNPNELLNICESWIKALPKTRTPEAGSQ
jgi:Domain of unknown function (DUF4381)